MLAVAMMAIGLVACSNEEDKNSSELTKPNARNNMPLSSH